MTFLRIISSYCILHVLVLNLVLGSAEYEGAEGILVLNIFCYQCMINKEIKKNTKIQRAWIIALEAPLDCNQCKTKKSATPLNSIILFEIDLKTIYCS